jgi:hypothetical protein
MTYLNLNFAQQQRQQMLAGWGGAIFRVERALSA